MRKAVFLDRDGVLVRDTGYPHRIEGMEILPGAADAIARLRAAGFLIVVVSNQSGVARGLFGEKDVEGFNSELGKRLETDGGKIDAFYFCPHHLEAKEEKYRKECDCRKPKPGMLLRAAREHGISLPDSWMVGDNSFDSAAGKAAGCRTIQLGKNDGADFLAMSIGGAQEIIFENETRGKLLGADKLRNELEKARKRGKKIVFTNGCFDMLHAGHADYLRKARKLGDILVLGLNSDSSVRRIKGQGRPINPEFMRAKVLSSLCDVDFITIFTEGTPVSLVERIRPDVYVKGGDWKAEDLPEKRIVEGYGGKVVLVPVVEGVSTTGIIRAASSRK